MLHHLSVCSSRGRNAAPNGALEPTGGARLWRGGEFSPGGQVGGQQRGAEECRETRVSPRLEVFEHPWGRSSNFGGVGEGGVPFRVSTGRR